MLRRKLFQRRRRCRRHRTRSAHTRRQTRLETARSTRQRITCQRVATERLRHRRRRSRRCILQWTPAQRIQTRRHLRRPYPTHATTYAATHIAHLGAAHRRHSRLRDRTGHGRDTGLFNSLDRALPVQCIAIGRAEFTWSVDNFLRSALFVHSIRTCSALLGVTHSVGRGVTRNFFRGAFALRVLLRLITGWLRWGAVARRIFLSRHRKWRGSSRDVSERCAVRGGGLCFERASGKGCLGFLCCLPSRLSGIPDPGEVHFQPDDGALVGLRGDGFRPHMIGYVVGMVAHHGEPLDPRDAGLPLKEVRARCDLAFEGVAVGGKPGFSGPLFVGNTLDVAFADTRPELTDGHLGTDARWPLNISRTP